MKYQLTRPNNSFSKFFCFSSNGAERMRKFSEELEDVISGRKLGIYIILDDPAGNSYLQNIYAPEPDPEMEVVHYERTFDQNEELGLNDIKVENYS